MTIILDDGQVIRPEDDSVDSSDTTAIEDSSATSEATVRDSRTVQDKAGGVIDSYMDFSEYLSGASEASANVLSSPDGNFGAHMRQSNKTVQAFNKLNKFGGFDYIIDGLDNPRYVGPLVDPDFNLKESLETIPEEDRPHYDWCRSNVDVQRQTEALEQERTDHEIIVNSGALVNLFNGATAMLLDPLNYLGAGAVKAIGVTGVAASAGAGALYGTEGYLFSEEGKSVDILYDTVAFSLFHTLGTGGKAALTKMFPGYDPTSVMAQMLKGYSRTGTLEGAEDSMLDMFGASNDYTAPAMNAAFKWMYSLGSPVGHLFTSSYKTSRQVAQMFLRSALLTKESLAGGSTGPSVESLKEVFHANFLDFSINYKEYLDKYLDSQNYMKINQFKRNRLASTFDEDVREALLNHKDHLETLIDGETAVRRIEHDDPNVAAAANLVKDFQDKLYGEAWDLKVLSRPNPEGFREYLSPKEAGLTKEELIEKIISGEIDDPYIGFVHRIWDVKQVLKDKDELVGLFTQALRKQDVREGIIKINENLQKKLDRAFEIRELGEGTLQHELSTKLETLKSTYDKEVSELLSPDIDAKTVSTGREKNVLKVKSITQKYLKDQKELETSYDKKINRLYEKTEAMLSEHKAEAKQLVETYTPDEDKLIERALDQYSHILGLSDGEPYAITGIGKQSLSKERTVLIDDRLLSKWLVRSPRHIVGIVNHKLSPGIARAKVLKRFGYESMDDVYKALYDEYKYKDPSGADKYKKIEKIFIKNPTNKANDPKNAADMSDSYYEFVKDKEMISDMSKLIEGTFGTEEAKNNPNVNSIIASVRNVTYPVLLPAMVFSAFADVSNIIARWGFTPTAKAFARYLKDSIGDLSQYSAVQRKEFARMGAAIEMVSRNFRDAFDSFLIENTTRMMPEAQQFYNPETWAPFRGLQYTTRLISSASSYINPNLIWTDIMKRVNSRMFIDKLSRTILKGSKNLNQADRRFLAEARYPLESVDAAKEMLARHGESYSDIFISNFTQWENKEASEIFCASVVTNSNNTIIVPGIGDIPRWFRKDAGKILAPLKSYIFAANNNILGRFATREFKGTGLATTLSQFTLHVAGTYLRSMAQDDPYDPEDINLYKTAALKMDLLGWGIEPAKIAYDVISKTRKYGEYGFHNAIMSNIPAYRWLGKLGEAILFKGGNTPKSEFARRQSAAMWPLYRSIGIEALVNHIIRENTMAEGGKLMKTRYQRYIEERSN